MKHYGQNMDRVLVELEQQKDNKVTFEETSYMTKKSENFIVRTGTKIFAAIYNYIAKPFLPKQMQLSYAGAAAAALEHHPKNPDQDLEAQNGSFLGQQFGNHAPIQFANGSRPRRALVMGQGQHHGVGRGRGQTINRALEGSSFQRRKAYGFGRGKPQTVLMDII